MTPFPALFADGGWIMAAAFIAFIILSFLTQAVSQYQDAQKAAMRRARKGAAETPPRASDSLEDEIAEFLRRAAERKTPGQAERPKPARAERPAPPPLAPPVVKEEVLRPFRPPPLRPAPGPPETEPVAVEPLPIEREAVAEHVEDRFRESRFGRVGSAGLGEQVAQADDKIDERLREKFGHGLGRLAAESGETTPAVAVAAGAVGRPSGAPAVDPATIATLLTNPATLRQAILASEILRRPEERWGRSERLG